MSRGPHAARPPSQAPDRASPLAREAWALLQAMRPRQWTKNGTIFLALLFSVNQYWSPFDLVQATQLLVLTGAAFLVFCMLSSGEYLINDLADIDQDRLHPAKRLRPLASGRLRASVALAAAVVLLVGGIGLAFVLQRGFGIVATGYAVLMLAYTAVLKHTVILDVFTLAAGFVLRVVAGAVVIAVPISPWLYLCTVLGALFLGLAKRRHELTLLEQGATAHRPVLEEYSPRLLDQMIAVVTPSLVIAYSLYTFTAESLPRNHAMMLTIPFVLYGIFRYLYLVHNKQQGGRPEEVLLSDLPLIIDIVLWLATAGIILVLFRGS
ncbi:MAG: decaprenyl-phosphate phosphoribosyltransferase [Chloroflexi bacterium]|nr:decaprenyl-phosphate phosphoribosyltransferase [Chloroflexota bacterium]